MKLTPEIIEVTENATPHERAYLTSQHFYLFAVYYYSEYFTHPFAPYHEDLFQDFEDLVYGRIVQPNTTPLKDVAWVIHREGAKTSIAKIGLAWILARQKVINSLRKEGENVDHWGERRYINVDSYDKENAESLLFDVVLSLQTNELLIQDFGHLYNKKRSKDEAQMKRISNFVTPEGIRVEAHTALTPMRGRLYQKFRPDFVLRDDLENKITADSPKITEKIISLVDEAKGGMAQHGASLTLGNYILEEGIIGYVMKSVRGSGGIVRFIPVVDKEGNIAWPAKYVHTDEEAEILNRDIKNPAHRKVSLQSKKRELNAGGSRVYEEDMLLDPIASGSTFFDRDIIDELIEVAKKKTPIEEIGELKIFKKYRQSDTYAIGADTAKGNGRDHNASVGIGFSSIPAQQVFSFADNMIPPDLFAHELKKEANMYGQCLIGPEKNTESGGTCLTTLKGIYPMKKIFQQIPFDKIHEKPTAEIGWETNSHTKYMILDNLRTAVQQGLLVINDIRILKEMRSFTYTDADNLGKTKMGLATNHFDLLMACAIAWEMRKYARPADAEDESEDDEQEDFESPTL